MSERHYTSFGFYLLNKGTSLKVIVKFTVPYAEDFDSFKYTAYLPEKAKANAEAFIKSNQKRVFGKAIAQNIADYLNEHFCTTGYEPSNKQYLFLSVEVINTNVSSADHTAFSTSDIVELKCEGEL